MSSHQPEPLDQRWGPSSPDQQQDHVHSATAPAQWRQPQAPAGNDSTGEYSPACCNSPSPECASSDDASMKNHKENLTPPESPGPSATMGLLSLEEAAAASSGRPRRPGNIRGHGSGILGAATAAKRSASGEMMRSAGRRSPARDSNTHAAGIRKPMGHAHQTRAHHVKQPVPHSAAASYYPSVIDMDPNSGPRHPAGGIRQLSKVDSGYGSLPSRQNTMPQEAIATPKRQTTIIQVSGRQRFSGLILQPDSSPISQEQLQAEVKGIYHGLLMVEAKCINIDSAQAADPNTVLGPEQWQALIALHRTLLYEHHDFLMATQHPSSTPMLRGLAIKYSMPARMWKHGIHAFLEVLRRRRPESQDYMLSFIYLAYQMIALLFETVPTFLDTWIECLGDLARYRMAIEQDKEAHAQWGAVAARWYTMAADRYPQIGRLNHHLGILERPSLRKFCFYAKSLNCVLPFPNAKDSLTTLCNPIIQDEQTIQNSGQSAEARVVTFHALIYANKPYEHIAEFGISAVALLVNLPTAKLRDLGTPLAVANVAVLFDLGNLSSPLWLIYGNVHKQSVEQSRPSMATDLAVNSAPDLGSQIPDLSTATSNHFELRRGFAYNTANSLLRSYDNVREAKDILPFAHVMLVWLHSLFAVQLRLAESETLSHDTINSLLSAELFSWGGLAAYLTSLARHERVPQRVVDAAVAGEFPRCDDRPEVFKKPLSEDYMIRGLLWSQFYFAAGWFDGTDEDDSRHIDPHGEMTQARLERVLWLGLYFAHRTKYLLYDAKKQVFSAAISGPSAVTPSMPATTPVSLPAAEQDSQPVPRGAASPAASSTSERSAEDGFTLVNHASKRQSKRSQLGGLGRRTGKHDRQDVRVVGEDGGMEWETT